MDDVWKDKFRALLIKAYVLGGAFLRDRIHVWAH
jgi:hypothetical protein